MDILVIRIEGKRAWYRKNMNLKHETRSSLWSEIYDLNNRKKSKISWVKNKPLAAFFLG
jgi:hypothetical protein